MKIGLLTYHCQPNFGAQLQAISSVGYLRKMGHTVVVLNWYPADLENMYALRIPQEQIDCHNRFTQETLPISKKCQTVADLISEIEDLNLDAIIAGSDALFKYFPLNKRRHFSFRKLKYINNSYQPLSCECLEGNPFFGGFLSNLKHTIPAAVYAVSSQNCPFDIMTKREKKEMANALSHYRFLSVRDSWTHKMVTTITKRKDIQICPDPVFSFNQNCYLSIPTKQYIIEKYNLETNYILFSFSGKRITLDYLDRLANEAKANNMQPVALPMPERLFCSNNINSISLPLSPIDWYALILYSCGYVGERMHPIVVCLHNAIPFFSFDEYGTKVKKNVWSKQMIYKPTSSKTYLIIEEAGLKENIFSYQTSTNLPSANYVISKIQNFDFKKCSRFAEQKQTEYKQGMLKTLSSLIM